MRKTYTKTKYTCLNCHFQYVGADLGFSITEMWEMNVIWNKIVNIVQSALDQFKYLA